MPRDDTTAAGSPASSNGMPTILVTREDPGPVCDAVTAAGGTPLDVALLVTRWLPFKLPGSRGLDDYDWVAFTSARAVHAVAARALRDAWNWPPRSRAAAVGDRTAHELQARGWMPERVSTGTGARGLVRKLREHVEPGERLLFPCSALADSTLPDGVRDAGAAVDVVHVYDTETTWQRHPERRAAVAERLRDAFSKGCVPTCASPSAVRALVEIAEVAGVLEQLRQSPVVVLGSTTANAARGLDLTPIESGGRDLSGMARRAVEVARSAL